MKPCVPPRATRARSRHGSRTWRRDQRAVSETIGSALLIMVLFTTSAGLGLIIMSQSPEDRLHATFESRVEPGSGGWSDGDERVVLVHTGGTGVPVHEITIQISIDGAVTDLRGAGLQTGDGPFTDGRMTLGERWVHETTISLGQTVRVDVTGIGQSASSATGGGLVYRTIHSSSVVATREPCLRDTAPPALRSWDQSPPNVTTATAVSVDIVATFADDCAGVDLTSTPTFEYRIVGGSVPTWTALGPAVAVGVSTPAWRTTIPEPAGGWAQEASGTLEYRAATQPSDLLGNDPTGPSAAGRDPVDDLAAPTAQFTISCSGLDCVFDASGSVAAPNRSLVRHDWVFGDGNTAPAGGVTPSHGYASAGTYSVTLTVTDSEGTTDAVTHPVTVAPALHVHAIDHTKMGGSKADVLIRVHDANETAAEGVSVQATTCKSGGACETFTGTTDAQGEIVYTFGPPGGGSGTYLTCIDSIVRSGYSYDPLHDDVPGLSRGTDGETCYQEVV